MTEEHPGLFCLIQAFRNEQAPDSTPGAVRQTQSSQLISNYLVRLSFHSDKDPWRLPTKKKSIIFQRKMTGNPPAFMRDIPKNPPQKQHPPVRSMDGMQTLDMEMDSFPQETHVFPGISNIVSLI